MSIYVEDSEDREKKLMEQSEKELVNKNLTQETIKRQQDILSKLLESEKAVRERELDEKREAEKAKELKNEVPPSFEKYLKAKEKQIDLLKTVPPSLSPYYCLLYTSDAADE